MSLSSSLSTATNQICRKRLNNTIICERLEKLGFNYFELIESASEVNVCEKNPCKKNEVCCPAPGLGAYKCDCEEHYIRGGPEGICIKNPCEDPKCRICSELHRTRFENYSQPAVEERLISYTIFPPHHVILRTGICKKRH